MNTNDAVFRKVDAHYAQQDLESTIFNALTGCWTGAHAKEAVRSGLDMGEADEMNYEALQFAALFATSNQKEGMHAFLEKRKPVFSKG